MEEFINNTFEIKKLQKSEFLSDIKVFFKNNKNEYYFNLKDYENQTNLYNINLGNLGSKFSQNDTIEIKITTEENININCIDPYIKDTIIKNNYVDIGKTELKNGENYFILRIINGNNIYIILVTFNSDLKNIFMNSENLPLEMKIYLKNNSDTDIFLNNFSKKLSQIINFPEENIILIKNNKKILTLCTFILTPSNNIEKTSKVCNKILDIYNLSKTSEKYPENNLFKTNTNIIFLFNNIVHIKSINFYSNKNLFYGLQIKSDNTNQYLGNINMNYSKKNNRIKLNDSGKHTNITTQLKDNDCIIKYYLNNRRILTNNNCITFESKNCFIDIEIYKDIKNIIIPNCYEDIKINEINKFKIYFEYKEKQEKNEIFTQNNKTFVDFDINKIKLLGLTTLVGIFGGIIYCKMFQKHNEGEIFIPGHNYDKKINQQIMKKEILKSKYNKYKLEDGFFNEEIDEKDIQIIKKLNAFKNKKIKKIFK